MIEVVADHVFKKHPPRKDEDGNQRRRKPGCVICGKGMTAPQHLGVTASVNDLLHNRMVYDNWKDAWGKKLVALLKQTDLPQPCDRIYAQGKMTFPDQRGRDQGNHRFLVEKALGDALQEGGWLLDDVWEAYEFGDLERAYEKGVSKTDIVLFPTVSSTISKPGMVGVERSLGINLAAFEQ